MKTLAIIFACLTLAACTANTGSNANYSGQTEQVAVQYEASGFYDAAEMLNFGE